MNTCKEQHSYNDYDLGIATNYIRNKIRNYLIFSVSFLFVFPLKKIITFIHSLS